jgi:fermentation-respiration switch protein FrsA (DUF1100 family)
MNMLIKIISWSLLLYLAYCVLLFLMQRHMMFPRSFIETPPFNQNISGLERIWLETSFGKVETWFLPPSFDNGSKPVPAVIFAHGNGELIDFWPHELKSFNQLGLGILLVEYPGYGRSKGSPSQKSITETFINAYDVLVAREEVDPAKIILFGRSLGGGAVCALAANRPSAALILMSTFISARSFASRYLAPSILVRDPFDNLPIVETYPGPILIVHGKYDTVISYSHGSRLYGATKRGKMITYDCGHNDCPANWDIFWRDIESFLFDAGLLGRSS